MQYLLNVQRQFAGNWVIEAGYLGTVSHHLYGFQDANQAIPFGYLGNGAIDAGVQRGFRSLNYGVIQLVADGGNANYNALSVKATRRFSQGLSVISSYTFRNRSTTPAAFACRAMTPCSRRTAIASSASAGFPRSMFATGFVTSVLYDLPFGKGKRLNIGNPVLERHRRRLAGRRHSHAAKRSPGIAHHRRRRQRVHIRRRLRPSDRHGRQSLSEQSDTFPLAESGGIHRSAARVSSAMSGATPSSVPGIFNIDFEVHKQFSMPYNENHALQFRLRSVQRSSTTRTADAEPQYPLGRGFRRSTQHQCAPGFRRDQRNVDQHAAGPTRVEVHFLSCPNGEYMQCVLIAVMSSGLCWGQAPDDCKPLSAEYSRRAVSLRPRRPDRDRAGGCARCTEGAGPVGRDS